MVDTTTNGSRASDWISMEGLILAVAILPFRQGYQASISVSSKTTKHGLARSCAGPFPTITSCFDDAMQRIKNALLQADISDEKANFQLTLSFDVRPLMAGFIGRLEVDAVEHSHLPPLTKAEAVQLGIRALNQHFHTAVLVTDATIPPGA